MRTATLPVLGQLAAVQLTWISTCEPEASEACAIGADVALTMAVLREPGTRSTAASGTGLTESVGPPLGSVLMDRSRGMMR